MARGDGCSRSKKSSSAKIQTISFRGRWAILLIGERERPEGESGTGGGQRRQRGAEPGRTREMKDGGGGGEAA